LILPCIFLAFSSVVVFLPRVRLEPVLLFSTSWVCS